MRSILFEVTESFRIAFGQIRAHKMRSGLTALGVIIGIVAVALMGTAIRGMDVSFERSLAVLGDDILYVQKWPWANVHDWWDYANRPPIRPESAQAVNAIIADTPGSLLVVAAPAASRSCSVKAMGNRVSGVSTVGTDENYFATATADFEAGRTFTSEEAATGRQVVVLGNDVATSLFPPGEAIGRTVLVEGHPFAVIGVLARQGTFLGLFSFDNQMLIPLKAFEKYFSTRSSRTNIRVKVRDKQRIDEAVEELAGAMRRVRGQLPGERDNFSINQQQAFKDQLGPVLNAIALAGFFITGLALLVGAIGIMNITYVSVKERTREIGTRKALGARRRAILLQFLVEAVSVCLIGGAVGLGLTLGLCLGLETFFPKLPIELSPGLVASGMLVSTLTGVVAGFAPALNASQLDPVEALRYE
jgi:putative ABC transport system permease protein